MRKYFILTIWVMASIFLLEGVNVNAETKYGFETEYLSSDEIDQIWNNIDVRTLPKTLSLDEISTSIASFDVNENENILIGLKDSRIIVLDNKKNLLYGFQFFDDGTFYVKWKDDNILLLLVRGSVIVEFSTDGQLVNMIATDDKSIQNNILWNQIRNKKKISINESVYLMRNQMGILNFFSSSYSQLIKEDINGEETIIYDVSALHTTKTVLMLIAVILFFTSIILAITRECIKYSDSTRNQSSDKNCERNMK